MNKITLMTLTSVAALSLTSIAYAGDHKGKHDMSGKHAMMKKMYKEADTNNDGNITKEEFQAQRNKFFAAADRNGDKKITMKEFADHKEVMAEKHRKAMEKAKQDRMKKAYKKIDTDGDGVISKAEFDAKSERSFIRKDHNDDGVLNKADRKRKMKKMKKMKKKYEDKQG